MVAGIVGGLLGLGGGFIMGPLFLELGVPPQVSLWYILLCYREINGFSNINFHKSHFCGHFSLVQCCAFTCLLELKYHNVQFKLVKFGRLRFSLVFFSWSCPSMFGSQQSNKNLAMWSMIAEVLQQSCFQLSIGLI